MTRGAVAGAASWLRMLAEGEELTQALVGWLKAALIFLGIEGIRHVDQ